MREKKTPHTRLHIVKLMVSQGKLRVTANAFDGAALLGFSFPLAVSIASLINSLKPYDFYKSRTAYHDRTIWHDVYRVGRHQRQIYLKLIVQGDVLIVSLKER
ncbi:type II toxin-antitoxin system MqsR family toxin [Pluralibacter gergoviae]|uniref:Type II toxin-antitoxin system MqsR family toxin n=1 Tax=Pluralibacter gergoviae TaxID=61647 RepID=A0AAW8HU57_PLUGE|nr:type II toxin-antitoxin system MqsR family toxin [Pluralibacter gergoviae]MCV7757750.1 type II toxin-antitoxin system MqsR family toxin [Pluralibacter gergoviae]MDQ2312024.1 type II toxin-antitoxin system MqsR family toxin [Pluralibacter gergoviae]MDU4004453.1 type II toxin-antitoxin system MqsR family toxin [Pluralibacter gergoviae]MDU4432022.1 type II toxin-antitoxin system MqsR family toxin [Pluralibacter gergoviae]SUB74058.1 mRNA interferase MqsR [Pluralibacter gergoviae]